MPDVLELNGHNLSREDVRGFLAGKKIALWGDWCITDPRRMEKAIDWFMGEMSALSASTTVPAPSRVKGKKAKKNGTVSGTRRSR